MRNVFCLGDLAYNKDNPVVNLAQVALQQGQVVARNIMALRQEKQLTSYDFTDFGEMLSLGIGKATLVVNGVNMSGRLVFEIRRLVYVSKFPSISLAMRSTVRWLFTKKY